MLELMTPLFWMCACWACGIFTGLGLGAAMGREQMARVMREEC